jgi:hypothetical protein
VILSPESGTSTGPKISQHFLGPVELFLGPAELGAPLRGVLSSTQAAQQRRGGTERQNGKGSQDVAQEIK